MFIQQMRVLSDARASVNGPAEIIRFNESGEWGERGRDGGRQNPPPPPPAGA